MQRILIYLQRLLAQYDCVVIPSLGAFLKESLSPRYDSHERIVYPGKESYCFNAAIKDRDNLLESAYAQSYGISLRRARLMVDKDSEELKDLLLRTSSLSIGRIGALMIEEGGSIVFYPSESSSLLGQGDNYGLTAYPIPCNTMLPLEVSEEGSPERARVLSYNLNSKQDILNKKQNEGKYFYLRVKKNFLVASVACFLLFGCILFSFPASKPLLESTYSAGFTEKSVTAVAYSNDDKRDIPKKEIISQKRLDTCTNQEDAIKSEYYAIIACFQTERKVRQYIASLSEVSFKETLGYIPYGRKYVAYAYAASTKEEVEAFVQRLHKDSSSFPAIWILHKE